jgi:hypothetical protein
MEKNREERDFPDRERSGGTQHDDGRGKSEKAAHQPRPRDTFNDEPAPVEKRKPETATEKKRS